MNNEFYYVNGMISEHLSIVEILCNCGCGFGSKKGDFSLKTAIMFERIRNALCTFRGREVQLYVSSACRCEEYNTRVGGAKKSQHKKGFALDILKPDGVSYKDFYRIVCDVVRRQGVVGQYASGSFIHIDTRDTGGKVIRFSK